MEWKSDSSSQPSSQEFIQMQIFTGSNMYDIYATKSLKQLDYYVMLGITYHLEYLEVFIIPWYIHTFIMVIFAGEVHIPRDQTPSCVHKNYTRINYSKHLVNYRGIDTWNNLPESLREIKSYYSFKKIKLYLLSIKKL